MIPAQREVAAWDGGALSENEGECEFGGDAQMLRPFYCPSRSIVRSLPQDLRDPLRCLLDWVSRLAGRGTDIIFPAAPESLPGLSANFISLSAVAPWNPDRRRAAA